MTLAQKKELRSVAVETAVYAVLVVVYCYCVFHFFAARLATLSHEHRVGYACVGLSLMIVQGLVLELLARGLVLLLTPKPKARA